jgi:SAM-dependent methyltransferase
MQADAGGRGRNPARMPNRSAKASALRTAEAVLRLVGKRKKVLVVGSAGGSSAALPIEQDCDVVRVTLKGKETDSTSLSELLVGGTFDVVVFDDTFAALGKPQSILEEARSILTRDGYIVVSIPNVPGAVQALARSDEPGFTPKILDELFVSAGYGVESLERVVRPATGQTRLAEPRDSDGEIVQFVVKASPLSGEPQPDLSPKPRLVSAEKPHERDEALDDRYLAEFENAFEIQHRVTQLENELRTARDHLERERGRVIALQEQFDDEGRRSSADASSLRRERDDARVELERVVDALQAKELELARAREHAERLSAEASSAQAEASKVVQLRRLIEIALITIEEVERKANDAEEHWYALYDELEEARRSSSAELRESRNRRDQLEIVLRNRDADLAKNERSLADARESLAATTAALYDSRERQANVTAELTILKVRSNATAQRNDILTKNVDDLTKTVEGLTKSVSLLEEQLLRSEHDADALRRNYAELEQHFAAQTEELCASVQAESTQMATLIDIVQSSRFWQLKRWLRRLVRKLSP